jgi:hypothetical protein
MSYRTAILSSFEEYLASDDHSPGFRAEEARERKDRLSRLPYSVMLQVSFAEFDFANRWCWQHFGPNDGECLQRQSEYPMCDLVEFHSHTGKWMWYWLAKTDHNFGFSEWYFSKQADRDFFLASVDEINWGEKYT